MSQRISHVSQSDSSRKTAEMDAAAQSPTSAGRSSHDDLRQLARVMYLVLKQRQVRRV